MKAKHLRIFPAVLAVWGCQFFSQPQNTTAKTTSSTAPITTKTPSPLTPSLMPATTTPAHTPTAQWPTVFEATFPPGNKPCLKDFTASISLASDTPRGTPSTKQVDGGKFTYDVLARYILSPPNADYFIENVELDIESSPSIRADIRSFPTSLFYDTFYSGQEDFDVIVGTRFALGVHVPQKNPSGSLWFWPLTRIKFTEIEKELKKHCANKGLGYEKGSCIKEDGYSTSDQGFAYSKEFYAFISTDVQVSTSSPVINGFGTFHGAEPLVIEIVHENEDAKKQNSEKDTRHAFDLNVRLLKSLSIYLEGSSIFGCSKRFFTPRAEGEWVRMYHYISDEEQSFFPPLFRE